MRGGTDTYCATSERASISNVRTTVRSLFNSVHSPSTEPNVPGSPKRIVLGRMAAWLLCVAGFPLHLALCVLVTTCDRGPALYRCFRLGRHGERFVLFKYRSMKVNASHILSRGLKMIVRDTDKRLTPLGRWLRCGIDELPQLWNIARGEMAWVGPRPDPDWMLPHYGSTIRKRLSALPGLTGFAQVLNSRSLPTAEGYALDIWYLSHRTIWLYAWIILATPLYIAGWRSFGRKFLCRLRRLPEFQDLRRRCQEDLFRAREVLREAGNHEFGLPPNTVIS